MGRNRINAPQRQSIPFSTVDVSAPVAATAAVVTYAAITSSTGTPGVANQPVPAGYLNPANNPANIAHTILGLKCTVAADAVLAAASAPFVKIEDGTGNIVFTSFLTLNPEGITTGHALYELDMRFPLPMRGTAGRAMIITMPSNGANTVNKLTILGHYTELA